MSDIADPFNGHIYEVRIAHVQRSDGWIETTWNNMSAPGAFAAANAEEQEGSEPLPLAGAGVVVSLMECGYHCGDGCGALDCRADTGLKDVVQLI